MPQPRLDNSNVAISMWISCSRKGGEISGFTFVVHNSCEGLQCQLFLLACENICKQPGQSSSQSDRFECTNSQDGMLAILLFSMALHLRKFQTGLLVLCNGESYIYSHLHLQSRVHRSSGGKSDATARCFTGTLTSRPV